MGLCSNDVKSSYIAFHEHFNYIVMHFRCVLYMLSRCVLLGLDQAEAMMYLSLHVTCSCIFIHTYLHFFIFLYTAIIGTFLIVSLSLSLFLALVCSCHLNANLLHPRTLCVLGHLLLLTLHLLLYGSMMIKLERTFQRTFVDEVFIRNAMSFCRTFPTLTYPLSFIVGVGSHFVTSRSLVPL